MKVTMEGMEYTAGMDFAAHAAAEWPKFAVKIGLPLTTRPLMVTLPEPFWHMLDEQAKKNLSASELVSWLATMQINHLIVPSIPMGCPGLLRRLARRLLNL